MKTYAVSKGSPGGYLQVLKGIQRRTPVYGVKTLLSEFKLDKGSAVPLHQHPQEQTGFLVSGRILLVIAGDRHELGPGDSWAIPGGVEHGAEALEDSLLVEVFSPLREDYIP